MASPLGPSMAARNFRNIVVRLFGFVAPLIAKNMIMRRCGDAAITGYVTKIANDTIRLCEREPLLFGKHLFFYLEYPSK
jgi:hypothetical protein